MVGPEVAVGCTVTHGTAVIVCRTGSEHHHIWHTRLCYFGIRILRGTVKSGAGN